MRKRRKNGDKENLGEGKGVLVAVKPGMWIAFESVRGGVYAL